MRHAHVQAHVQKDLTGLRVPKNTHSVERREPMVYEWSSEELQAMGWGVTALRKLLQQLSTAEMDVQRRVYCLEARLNGVDISGKPLGQWEAAAPK